MKYFVQQSFVPKRISSNTCFTNTIIVRNTIQYNTCFENCPKRILNHSKVPFGFSIFDQMRLVNSLYEIVWGYALVVDST